VGQPATKKQNALEADILFEKEENTRQYSQYLLTSIAAVHINAYNDLASSISNNTPHLET